MLPLDPSATSTANTLSRAQGYSTSTSATALPVSEAMWGRGNVVVIALWSSLAKGDHSPCPTLNELWRWYPPHFAAQQYVCHDDGRGVVCSSTAETSGNDAEASRSGSLPAVGIADQVAEGIVFTNKEGVPRASTLWVCSGRRKPFYHSAGSSSTPTWFACKSYASTLSDDGLVPDRCCILAPKNETSSAQSAEIHEESEARGALDTGLPKTPPLSTSTRRMAEAWHPRSESTQFVHAVDGQCGTRWASWPSVQDKGLASGTVLVWQICPAVGNLFVTLAAILPVVRWLEVGLIIRWENLPGFRTAFEPGEIGWDEATSAGWGGQSEEAARGHHIFTFEDGSFILSDSQLSLLASAMGTRGSSSASTALKLKTAVPTKIRYLVKMAQIRDATSGGRGGVDFKPDSCAWNKLLRRSPSMVAAIKLHYPAGWVDDAVRFRRNIPRYVAWHVRTTEGESSKSFNPEHHKYLFDNQPSSDVCASFISATEKAEESCLHPAFGGAFPERTPVYVSSNSKEMARNCSQHALDDTRLAGFVDLGLTAREAHTKFSTNPNTVVNAFIDFLFLMDAAIIVRTGSSFSGTVATIKGLECRSAVKTSQSRKRVMMCTPASCRHGRES